MFALIALLVLIGAANTAPIIAKNVLRTRLSRPVDGGLCFVDGRPFFGTSKTWRGLAVAVLAPAIIAPLFGFEVWQGAAVGALAMSGDLLSSFIKRRLGLKPSSQAFGLDQIPESLLPAWVARAWFGLSAWDVLGLVIAFVALATVLSKLMFKLKLRDKPY